MCQVKLGSPRKVGDGYSKGLHGRVSNRQKTRNNLEKGELTAELTAVWVSGL